MDYFVNTPGPQPSPALCSDRACPCNPEVRLSRGEGYLYVSPEAVDFRLDARTPAATQAKMNRLAGNLDAILMLDPVMWSGLMVCKQGAILRGLDLDVAAADAREWWRSGRMPLRATPLRGTE